MKTEFPHSCPLGAQEGRGAQDQASNIQGKQSTQGTLFLCLGGRLPASRQ